MSEPNEQAVVETPLKTAADATNLDEYVKIREGAKLPAEPPKPPTEQTPPVSDEEDTAETAGDSDATTQEKPKRDRTFNGRISELTAANKKLQEQLAELQRKQSETPQAPAPPAAPQAKPDAPTAPADTDPKPKLADFTSSEKYESFEAAQEAYADARDAWKDRQREAVNRKASEEKQQAATRERVQTKATEARAKYADFDQVMAQPLSITPAMQQFALQHPQGLDAMYLLGKNPVEATRIAALSPVEQLAELAYLTRGSASAPTLEKPKPAAPPVSKAPPPPRMVGGTAPTAEKSTAEAGSLEEHIRLREAQSRRS